MPSPLSAPGEAGNTAVLLLAVPITYHDLTELVVARQQLIEAFELAHGVGLDWSAHMFVDKWFEPISQRARLRRNGIELAGKSAFPKRVQRVVRHQSSLLQPREKIFTRRQPLNLGIHRNRDGVQKIQSRVVGNKKR